MFVACQPPGDLIFLEAAPPVLILQFDGDDGYSTVANVKVLHYSRGNSRREYTKIDLTGPLIEHWSWLLDNLKRMIRRMKVTTAFVTSLAEIKVCTSQAPVTNAWEVTRLTTIADNPKVPAGQG